MFAVPIHKCEELHVDVGESVATFEDCERDNGVDLLEQLQAEVGVFEVSTVVVLAVHGHGVEDGGEQFTQWITFFHAEILSSAKIVMPVVSFPSSEETEGMVPDTAEITL
jgi:hypothetical protein